MQWWHFAVFGAVMHGGGMLAGIAYVLLRFQRPPHKTAFVATAAAVATGFIGGIVASAATGLVSLMATGQILHPTRYTILIVSPSPPILLSGLRQHRSRIAYALVAILICRGDNGQLQPNYSHVLGSFTAAGVSNLYRSSADRRASLTFRNGLIITGSGAVVNLMREFLSRQLTPNVPGFAQGKP